MWVDTGQSGDGPFKHYEASPDAIEASALELDQSYGNVEALSSDVDAAHRPALTGVSGVVAGPMAAAPRPARANAHQVMAAGMVAAGSVRVFGHAVQEFNEGVDALNAQWRDASAGDFFVAPATYPTDASAVQRTRIDEARSDAVFDAKVAMLKELELKYEALRAKLDKAADRSAGQLQEGPTDQVILDLFAAGGLPSTIVAAFPHLKFSSKELPPDLAELDEDEIEAYLRSHPAAAVVVNGLLVKDGLTDQEQAVVEAQARIDGDLLKQAMNAPPGADTLEDIAAAQERLRLINAHVAKTGELNDAAHSYTVAYVNEVGSDNLAKLPSVVEANVHEALKGAPQDVIAPEIAKYLSPVGDAILNLSNEQLQDQPSGVHGPGVATTSYRYDFNGDGVIDTNDMPKAIRELMDMRIGENHDGIRSGGPLDKTGGPTYDTITNLDAFNGWADLMSASTVEGGKDFSVDLAEQAIQAKQDMNAILGAARAEVDQLPTEGEAVWAELTAKLDDASASDLLSVAAQNEDASSELLIDDVRRQQVLGLNWDDGEGAGDVIRAGTDRDPDGGGGTEYQAEAAMEVMTEIASDPKEYMERAANESVSDAVVDVGITWVDTFGQPVTSDTTSHYNTGGTDAIGRPLSYSVTLSDADQQGFLQFIANTGDEDAIRFESGSRLYGQQLVSAALEGGYDRDPAVSSEQALEQALGWSGRADGQIHQATTQWALDELGDEHAEKRAELIAENRSTAATKTALKTALAVGNTIAGTAFPPAAPFLSVGTAIANPIIDGVLQEEPIPDFESISEQRAAELIVEDSLDAVHRRNYFLAEVALTKGATVPDELLNSDGTLRSFEEVSNVPNGLDRLDGISNDLIDDWNDANDADADIGRYNEARGETNPPIAPGDRRPDGGPDRNWDDDQVAEENLYGDNVPEGYASSGTPEEDSPQETYADENYQVDEAPWQRRTNDETANDRREAQDRVTEF
jgi:hypothetical protein